MSDFAELRIDGRLATPADADWDEVRLGWNLAADQRPSAVALVESAADAAAVVRFAAENDLRVAAQGTGHGALAMGPLDDTILLKTERLRSIEVDAGSRTARVGAGVLSADLAGAAGEHGLCFLPGSSPDVGVVGYTLGGGMSWFVRREGFACNHVRAIELVTADGERRTVDADNDADLFWALRGGGGSYAVVTALHVELLPIADVYGGALVFPAEVGTAAVRAYRDWAATAPDDITTVVRFITPPPIPDVPEPIRGKPLLTIDGAFVGSDEEGASLIAPLRELGEPIMDTFGRMPTPGLSHIHMDPEHPVPGLGHHTLVGELPDEAIEAFAGAGPSAGAPLLLAELRHLGGAVAREPENAGALAKIDAGFVMFAVGMLMAPEMRSPIEAALDNLTEALSPWGADGGYFNFADRPCDVDAILPPDVCQRLKDVKHRYDPDDRIVSNHLVSPTPA